MGDKARQTAVTRATANEIGPAGHIEDMQQWVAWRVMSRIAAPALVFLYVGRWDEVGCGEYGISMLRRAGVLIFLHSAYSSSAFGVGVDFVFGSLLVMCGTLGLRFCFLRLFYVIMINMFRFSAV